jgi:hypothetical protein
MRKPHRQKAGITVRLRSRTAAVVAAIGALLLILSTSFSPLVPLSKGRINSKDISLIN